MWGLGKCGGGEGIAGRQNPIKDNGAPFLCHQDSYKYCGVWGGGGNGDAKILQKIMAPPLSVNKIEQYCGARGRGYIGDAKSYKDNGAPPPSVIKIVKYCGVWGSGWGALWGVKMLQKIMAPPLPVIKIVKYCEVWGGGHWGGGGR